MIQPANCGADVEHSDSLPYDDQQARKVRVRRIIKQIASEERRRIIPPRYQQAPPVCAEIAPVITQRLLKVGIQALTVNGVVLASHTSDSFLMHFWTESEGLLIDVTLDQLGSLFPSILICEAVKCRDHPRLGLMYSPSEEFYACSPVGGNHVLNIPLSLRLYRIWTSYLKTSVIPILVKEGFGEPEELYAVGSTFFEQGRRDFLSGFPRIMNSLPRQASQQALTLNRTKRIVRLLESKIVADTKQLMQILEASGDMRATARSGEALVAFGRRTFEMAATLFCGQ